MSTLYLLDGTALAYRSHFAFARSGLSTADGKPTGATFGFASLLHRLIEEERPERIAVALDARGKTFRHKQFPAYKGTRQKAPEELISQLTWIREVIAAFGLPLFEIEGYEADDVLGTLAIQAAARGDDVRIVTGDKDFMQLVSEKIELYNVFKKGEPLVIQGIEAVAAKFGGTPAQVIDVLAIMGDASDNVPGVKGIGEKGAIALVEKFGSVAGILERLDELTPKQREKIEADREMLLLSRELVTINTEVPLDPGLESIGEPLPQNELLEGLYRELEFRSLLNKVSQLTSDDASAPVFDREDVLVRDLEQLEAMASELRAAGRFAVDTETTSLFPLETELVGVSFSAAEGRAFYVPFVGLDPPVDPKGPAALLERLASLLTDPGLERIGQNTKYDWLVFRHAGLELPDPDFDTMLASFSLAGSARSHGLDNLALHHFGQTKIPTKELIGTGAKQITMADVPVERVCEYACEDAEVTYRLYEVLQAELEDSPAADLFRKIEMPLVPVLERMEARGIRIDEKLLASTSKELTREIDRLEGEIHDLAGEVFKVGSTKVLGQILFEKLAIHEQAGKKKAKRTKTGYATDAATLTESYGDVEIVQKLLEFRELTKLKSTYLDALPRYVNEQTGRIHCSFSQVSAATGRLASSDPNLQNIPIRSERGRTLRRAFVPREPDQHGPWAFLAADYSQIELRVMAHLSGDPSLIEAFQRGDDIHASTAARLFGVAADQVDRTQRSRAKVINFGLLYGMGPHRVARETGMDLAEAKDFIERYFSAFPTVRQWMDHVLETAREVGYVETLLGRRRRVPDIDSKNSRVRSFAENAAINTPVQGSAADIIKRAMIDVDAALQESDLSAQMLLQVHDELLFEVPQSELEATIALVQAKMSAAVDLVVPLEVDCGTGANWLEAH